VSRDLCCKAPIYRKWKPTEELHDIYTWHPANKEQIMRWLRKRIRSPDRIIQKNPMSDQFIESAVEVFRVRHQPRFLNVTRVQSESRQLGRTFS
jgi:hypothetical protein